MAHDGENCVQDLTCSGYVGLARHYTNQEPVTIESDHLSCCVHIQNMYGLLFVLKTSLSVTHRQVVGQARASCLASISWQGQANISHTTVSIIGAVEA
jgi:hypothetical protein